MASNDPAATAVGVEVLRSGGNAVDAAVATALALAVTFPEAGNLAGGGFALVRMGGEVAALDFREVAPRGARREMFLDDKGNPRPDASTIGPLASGVPGSPAGLRELHRRFGRLPWAQVVEPARRLAAAGLVVDGHLHEVLGRATQRPRLTRFSETVGVWYPGGEPAAVGTRISLAALERTLAAYAERGPEAISGGPVGAAIEAASRKHGGVLEAADLASYRPEWREPLLSAAYGWSFAGMPLPSAGGTIVAQTLAMLEKLGWERLPRFGADRAHLLAEAFRRSYVDRTLLGDPASSRARPADLLDPGWIARRVAGIDLRRAIPTTRLLPWPGGRPEPSETTHLSVADGAGNLVALTTTLNDLFGCGVYVPEIGFLNNEMDDFATAPGRPNLFGLVQGDANAVAPGKRMPSSMAPTLAWRGEESLAAGGRGGSRIPTYLVQVLLNLLVDGDPLQAALDRPRLHHQGYPDRLEGEADAFAPETRDELARRGHEMAVTEVDKTAKIFAVRRLPGGDFEAAVDPRGPGRAAAVTPLEDVPLALTGGH